MDNVYIAWIIAMIGFAGTVEILDDAQWGRKKHKVHIPEHRGRSFR